MFGMRRVVAGKIEIGMNQGYAYFHSQIIQINSLKKLFENFINVHRKIHSGAGKSAGKN